MSMEVALARRAAIVEFTRKIMVRDRDFGEIPGTSKPTLLKPGAEKLCNFFGLEPEFTPVSLRGLPHHLKYRGCTHGCSRIGSESSGLHGHSLVRTASPYRQRLLSQTRTAEICR